MKIEVRQSQFEHVVKMCSGIVNKRSTLPVLGNLLVEAKDRQLTVMSSNLEQGIRYVMPAVFTEDGVITTDARMLSDVIGAAQGDTVVLETSDDSPDLVVSSKYSHYRLKTIDPQEFPPLPMLDEQFETVQISAEEMKKALGRVLISMSTDPGRESLAGVRMVAEKRKLVLVTTDGFRISEAQMVIDSDVEFALTVPGRTMTELRKYIDQARIFEMGLLEQHGQVIYRCDDVQLISVLINGNYPDWTAIMPQKFDHKMQFSASQLNRGIRQAQIVAQYGTGVVVFDFEDEHVRLTGKSDEMGEAEAQVHYQLMSGNQPESIAFNGRYMRDALGVLGTDAVMMSMNKKNAPVELVPVNDQNYRHVVMPMNIKG